MVAIILCVIAILVALGIEFGIVEAISLTILVGISVDFSLHLAEAFTRSHFTHRGLRGVDAVSRVGYPIFSAAVTTLSAVLPMLWCKITILVNFAQIIPLCISASLVYGLHFFAPVLMIVGPNVPGGGAGKWCCHAGKLPNVLFATQTRRMIFLIACGLLFGWCLPATRERILDEKNGIGATTFVGIAIGFAVSSVIAVVVEESCSRCRKRLNEEESRAESARHRRDARFLRAAALAAEKKKKKTRIHHHHHHDDDDTHDDDTHDETGAKNHRRPIVAAPRRRRFSTFAPAAANTAAPASDSDADSLASDAH